MRVLTIQYHGFGGLQSGMKRFRLFFRHFYVTKRKMTVTVTQKPRIQYKNGQQNSLFKMPRQKRHKRKNVPCPCIPPGSAASGRRFPPKTASAPPAAKSNADILRTVHPAGNPPESVTSRARTAYAGGRIFPPSVFTISRGERGSKRKMRRGEGKDDVRPRFARAVQILSKQR